MGSSEVGREVCLYRDVGGGSGDDRERWREGGGGDRER